MTALAFVVLIVAALVSGFVVFRAIRFSDEVDDARVRSDGFHRTDHASRETLARLREGK